MRNIITIALLVGCVLLGKAQNEADKWLKEGTLTLDDNP